jgi:PPK2 family polyphosphate:nucleotide phosphotransferase
MDHRDFQVTPGSKVRLADYDPGFTGEFADKREAKKTLARDVERLAKYQQVLYAQNTHALLVILQGMDTSGKDSTIRHVMSGVNPQGTQVHSFKPPSEEELDHDYLWRSTVALPAKGNIGIFNRSYYEEVVVVRVHPDLLARQRLPAKATGKRIWAERFEDINNFERYLTRNGIVVLKFFLHLSKEEQKSRLLARIDEPEKNWKFSRGDTTQREHWDDYMEAYEAALENTSTAHAPWYVVPADHKWFARAVVADAIVERLKSLRLAYPTLTDAERAGLAAARRELDE